MKRMTLAAITCIACIICINLIVSSVEAKDGSSKSKESRWQASKIGYQPTLLIQLAVTDRVLVRAGSPSGVAHGTATLLQLLGTGPRRASLPCARVRDRSDAPHRCLMVDVARHPHPVAVLRQVVDLCRFYKIDLMQLHLTDDEGWTFPSASLPLLGTENLHGVPRYQPAELRELHAYASDRGVTLVPEIDLPGHCGAMLRAMPELFDPVRAGLVNVATERVWRALEALIGEVADLFPASPLIHFGADEVRGFEKVYRPHADDPWVRSRGIGNPGELFTAFMHAMTDLIEARGKRAAAWEGHRANDDRLRRILIVAWNNSEYPIEQLIADGYEVINAAWCPLYLLENRTDVTPRFLYTRWDRWTWGRYEAEPRTIARCHLHRIEPNDRIPGCMLCSWENRSDFQVSGLRPLAPAFAERLWNPAAAVRGYPDFEARARDADLRLGSLL